MLLIFNIWMTISWLLYNWTVGKSCILADEMGLGKTVQTVALISHLFHHLHLFPFLIIVPNSTVRNWEAELARWAPLLHVAPYYGTPDARKIVMEYLIQTSPSSKKRQSNQNYVKCHVVLTSYEICLRNRVELERIDWELMVVDEGQRLKSATAKLSKLLTSIGKVHWRLLLTGTPLQNSMSECFNLLAFVDAAKFGDAKALEKFGVVDKNNIGELHALLQPYILRRLKKDVLKGLIPEKVEVLVAAEMSAMQKELYRLILSRNSGLLRMNKNAREKYARRTGLSNIMMELRKLVNHPYLIQGGLPPQSASLDDEKRHRALIDASGKFKITHRLLQQLRQRDNRVLIFFTSTQMMNIFEVTNTLLPPLFAVVAVEWVVVLFRSVDS